MVEETWGNILEDLEFYMVKVRGRDTFPRIS